MFLKDKSYQFSLSVIALYQALIREKKEFILSKQFLRSGTAVGALIREAEFAQSHNDYIHKLSIALKEANECLYWIELLIDANYFSNDETVHAKPHCEELIRLLVSSIKTLKSKTSKK